MEDPSAFSKARAILPILPDTSDHGLEYEDNFRELAKFERGMPANTKSRRKILCRKLPFFPFPVDDPTRGETATRCQPLQEVARELTLLPYWVCSSLPFSLLSPIR
jgi:hypothetical protein